LTNRILEQLSGYELRLMRYAYIKPNNCVHELKRLGIPPKEIPEGGPDAYVGHFLEVADGFPCLIISEHLYPQKDEVLKKGNVEAYSYCIRPSFGKIGKRFGNVPFISLPLRIWIALRIYYKLVRFKPDFLLSWTASFSLWASYLASKNLSVPFIYSRHTRFVKFDEAWFKKVIDGIDKYIIRQAEAIIVHGPYIKKEMLSIKVKPQKIIEFNWSFKHFFEAKKNPEPSFCLDDWKSSKIILFVGRLEARKGVFDLLAAYQKILRASNECTLAYAGSGGAYDALCEKIKALELESRVRLLGMVPHNQLPHIIRDCYIVVTPSRSVFAEGRCMATMEGLVLGKPVIAPNNGPFPFLVKDHQNGLLFHPDSVEDLYRKINKVINDDELYARLKKGAEETAEILVKASVNFSNAVSTAFKKAAIY
jgi:glycosyltransferase involved in cell wall biosynthesis